MVFKCRLYQVYLRRVDVSEQWSLRAGGLLIQVVSKTGLTVFFFFEGMLISEVKEFVNNRWNCNVNQITVFAVLDLKKKHCLKRRKCWYAKRKGTKSDWVFTNRQHDRLVQFENICRNPPPPLHTHTLNVTENLKFPLEALKTLWEKRKC